MPICAPTSGRCAGSSSLASHIASITRHFGHNFGKALSIWDRIFRTAWHNADEYPSTGIIDPRFPLKEGAPAVTAARYYVNQTIYPFKALVP